MLEDAPETERKEVGVGAVHLNMGNTGIVIFFKIKIKIK